MHGEDLHSSTSAPQLPCAWQLSHVFSQKSASFLPARDWPLPVAPNLVRLKLHLYWALACEQVSDEDEIFPEICKMLLTLSLQTPVYPAAQTH